MNCNGCMLKVMITITSQYTHTHTHTHAHTHKHKRTSTHTHNKPVVGFLTGDVISISGDFVFFLVACVDSTGLLDFAFFSSRGFTVTLAFVVTSNT